MELMHNCVLVYDSFSTFLTKTIYQQRLLNNKLVLIQYYMSYILLRQNLSYPKISVTLNLSNINILFRIFPLTSSRPNEIIVNKEKEDEDLSKSVTDHILNNINSLKVLHEFRIISQKNYDYIQLLASQMTMNKKRQLSDFNESQCNASKRRQIFHIDNEQSSVIIDRKRHVPDFDDIYTIPAKRVKPIIFQEKTGSDLDAASEKCNFQTRASLSNSERNESLKIITQKWDVNSLANPHINYTHCVHITGGECEQQYEYNQQNFSCLRHFDEEIAVVDQNIYNTSQRIDDLYKKYSAVVNFSTACEIYDIIDKEKRNENNLKSRYASLCDARNEIFNLYVNQKKSTMLNFNAELMSQSESNMIKINRELLNSFQNHYAM